MSEHIKMEHFSINRRDCFISVLVSLTGCFSAIRIYSVYKTNVNNVPKRKFGNTPKKSRTLIYSVFAFLVGTFFIRGFIQFAIKPITATVEGYFGVGYVCYDVA